MTHDAGSAAVAGIALVTGGGSGIGAATARRLAARGLHVVVSGRTAARLDDVVSAIAAAGGSAEAVAADCGDDIGRAAILATLGQRPVRAFVHAAGLDRIKSLAQTDRADFDALMAVNVAAPFFLCQGLLDRFTAGASITLVGSVAARRGMRHHVLYGASKAALIGMTVNLAQELAPRVRVNLVSPGGTDTAMLADYVARSRAGLSEKAAARQHIAESSRMLLRRVAAPDEVAATIVHLALDATAMTGVDLPVDVGYTAS